MGTRSITAIVDNTFGDSQLLCQLYRQMDGNPEVHGDELVGFLLEREVTNGIRASDDEAHPPFNGGGDLAVRLITHLKNSNGGRESPGNFYLHGGSEIDTSFDYTYIVTAAAGKPIHLKVLSWGDSVFDGSLDSWPAWYNEVVG